MRHVPPTISTSLTEKWQPACPAKHLDQTVYLQLQFLHHQFPAAVNKQEYK